MSDSMRRRCIPRAEVVFITIVFVVTIMTFRVNNSPAVGAVQRADRMRIATSTRVISLIENASLRVTKTSGSILEAQGPVSGTLSGSLSLHTVVNSASRMTTSFVGAAHSGTLSGTTGLDYGVSGNTLYYTGTASITHGTGVYAHAHATGIHVEGTMDRKRRIVTIHISGRLSV